MKQTTVHALVISVILILSLPIVLDAQQTASLSGRVVDPQGNVVSGAAVSATLKSTSIRRAAATNEAGMFVISNLAPGEYEVQVIVKGFARKVYPSVALHVGQASSMDIPLSIGDAEQTFVLVEREQTPLVNTTSSAVDGVVTARTIESMPLNGRNFLELALLVPGNSPAPNFDPTKTNTVLISSAGQLGPGRQCHDRRSRQQRRCRGRVAYRTSRRMRFRSFRSRPTAFPRRSADPARRSSTSSPNPAPTSLHGSTSFYLRDNSLQGLPATFDRRNPTPPFDREQYSAAAGRPGCVGTAPGGSAPLSTGIRTAQFSWEGATRRVEPSGAISRRPR